MNTIISVNDFKKFNPSSSLTDEQIQLYCMLITEWIHEYASVSLEEGEHTETILGNGTDKLFLMKRPVTSLTALKSNRTTLDDVVILDTKNGIKRLNGIFTKGQDIYDYLASRNVASEKITITYTGGYRYPTEDDAGNVPELLKYALCAMINGMIEDTGETGNLKSYRRDDVAYEFKTANERNSQFIAIIGRFI